MKNQVEMKVVRFVKRALGVVFAANVSVAPLVADAVELRELSRRSIRESASPMNFCHAKNFSDGTIYLGHSFGVHTVDESGAGMMSVDGGKTWRKGGRQMGGMNAFLTKDGKKRWLECWASRPEAEHFASVTTMDADGKVTVDKARVVCPRPMAMHFYRDVVRISDGALLQCGYFADPEVPSFRRGIKGQTACLLKSEDEGMS